LSVGAGASRVLQVDQGASATLSCLTIADGVTTGDGGGLLNQGSVNLSGDAIVGNPAVNGGDVASSGSAVILGSAIDGSSASADGGVGFNTGSLAESLPSFVAKLHLLIEVGALAWRERLAKDSKCVAADHLAMLEIHPVRDFGRGTGRLLPQLNVLDGRRVVADRSMKRLAVEADGRERDVLCVRPVGKCHFNREAGLPRLRDCSAARNELTVERALSIAAFMRGSSSATFVTLSAGY
jgi:hypothetical protein